MSLKTYTINVAGDDNGNVIAAPFTIEVLQITDYSEEGNSFTQIWSCTKNGSSAACGNSDIPEKQNYELQGEGVTRAAALTATIEADLDAAYGVGNWT